MGPFVKSHLKIVTISSAEKCELMIGAEKFTRLTVGTGMLKIVWARIAHSSLAVNYTVFKMGKRPVSTFRDP